MARKVVDDLGGHGLFGVEFFVAGDEAIFSELSPRPHDTGMVTSISQNLSEFDLHARAILGLPIPEIRLLGPSASAVILADREAADFAYEGMAEALALGGGRCAHLRQAGHAPEPADGRGAGAGRAASSGPRRSPRRPRRRVRILYSSTSFV